jgi:hypothetical protein
MVAIERERYDISAPLIRSGNACSFFPHRREKDSMSVNKFAPRKFEDFVIVDDVDARVGWIRVKPSGVLWAPKGARKWFGVDLATFAEFMEKKGKLQRK